ncbi:MAG: nucleotidyltransferase family protein [Leptolinea sp.]|nr:nucleotidyltransferase family protein [Leptolinea sp.]
MGSPKMNLPWRGTTVLGSVINTLVNGGVNQIYVIVNPIRLPELPASERDIRVTIVENPEAESSEMLVSIQTGLRSLPEDAEFAMICLGDQPTIQANVVSDIKMTATQSKGTLIFPSYRKRRGHPWLVGRVHWAEIMALDKNDTIRIFLERHKREIHYLDYDCDAPQDIDTPEDYQSMIRTTG